jgi:hypothetical protein
MERRILRQLDKDLPPASGLGDPPGPPPHRAKDWLGAIVTIAIIGAILVQLTYGLASRCGVAPTSRDRPGTCSGLAAMANHARGPVTLAVAACGALAAIAFAWYMLWGYKTGGQARGTQDISGS